MAESDMEVKKDVGDLPHVYSTSGSPANKSSLLSIAYI